MPHCKLKNCPYDRDGRCVENQLPNCPNLLADEATGVKVQEVPPQKTEPPPPTHESTYSGNKLTVDEAAPILQSNPQVVVLGGMIESGKTTLLARIFEMFQCGEIVGYRFMTSKTPVEFDKLSWHATMESGANKPTTVHTARSENNLFLHLRFRPISGANTPIDLLLGDIPGELFPEAVAEESVCRNLSALGRANHVLLFLDAEVLTHAAKRHDHCGKVFDFVSRALQTGQIGQNTVLHLITSKSDVLVRDPKISGNVLKFVDGIEQSFRAKFGPKVGGLHVARVAARPELNFQPTFKEINELFRLWTTRATPHSNAFMKPPSRSSFHRDFCRFGL